jgi:hypothetical protein
MPSKPRPSGLIDAQEVVAEAIDARTPPEPGQVDVVVHRAEDVGDLAQEAAHHADELDQSRSSSSTGLDAVSVARPRFALVRSVV